MRVEPVPLLDVTSFTPAMTPRRRSSGVATLVAMVSGLAPGRLALTEITGKSTCGSGATASMKKAAIPARPMPIVSSTVATGRLTKGDERFIVLSCRIRSGIHVGATRWILGRARDDNPFTGDGIFLPAPLARELVEPEVDHRRGEQRQHLAHHQPAENREAERAAQLGAFAPAE